MSRPLRVLWLIKGLGPGGAEQLLVSSAQVRDTDATTVETAVLLDRKLDLAPELEGLGVPVHQLHGNRSFDPRWMLRLRSLVRERKIDVVHTHSPQVAAFARVALRALPGRRPALVYTEHLPWDGYRTSTRFLNRITYGLDDAQIAVSRAVVDSMPSGSRRRVRVIHQGLDRDAVRAHLRTRDAVRSELGVAPDEILIGTIANYRAQKDYPNLFAAARIVLDGVHPSRFVAMGQGPDRESVEAAYARAGFGEAFQLLGFRRDATRVLAACDLFVLASRNEGLPIALLEALTLGLPVAATAVGGTPEAVTDGVEGILVPPARPDLLAAAIVDLIEDPARQQRMGEAASTRSDAFDIAVSMRRTEGIYVDVVAARRSQESTDLH